MSNFFRSVIADFRSLDVGDAHVRIDQRWSTASAASNESHEYLLAKNGDRKTVFHIYAQFVI